MPAEILETVEKINSDLLNLKVPNHQNNLIDGEIRALKIGKGNTFKNIPIKILKMYSVILSKPLKEYL